MNLIPWSGSRTPSVLFDRHVPLKKSIFPTRNERTRSWFTRPSRIASRRAWLVLALVSTAAMLASRNPKWPTVSGHAGTCRVVLDLFRLHEPEVRRWPPPSVVSAPRRATPPLPSVPSTRPTTAVAVPRSVAAVPRSVERWRPNRMRVAKRPSQETTDSMHCPARRRNLDPESGRMSMGLLSRTSDQGGAQGRPPLL